MTRSRSPETGCRARSRRQRAAALLALGFAVSIVQSDRLAAGTERASVGSSDRAALVDRKELYLEARPLHGEGLLAFCRRLTGSTERCREIAGLNRNPRRLLAGVRYRVPYDRLAADLQLGVILALFPHDRARVDGWLHRSRGESLTRVAEWFTGDAGNVDAVRRANGRSGDRLDPGAEVLIPRDLLIPIFRLEVPPPGRFDAPSPAAAPASIAAGKQLETSPVSLEYAEDAEGAFAVYRLRGGEALYSAVVVRFTGRVHAEDVNALAAEIARRSGIEDVTDIPIGFPVRIPMELLQPEFLPERDPRRLEWEVEQALSAQYRNRVRARSLEGVTVVLDAGHGGSDVGASMSGVWESNYVYDVTLRIKRRLEAATLARVEITTRDGDGFVIVDRDVLPYSRGHKVLTNPPYEIGDSVVGVHLRWYLANAMLRQARSRGGGDKVVFVSLHADSLHPSLRGATVYVPDVAGTAGTYGKSGSAFQSRREVREQPRVSMPLALRQQSEGLSRDLASHVIAAFRSHDLAVHPFKPVRDRILRGRKSFVPAVLRYNEIPAKMLLEICNLANPDDRKLLQTKEFREEVAAAVVEGILAYFGEGS